METIICKNCGLVDDYSTTKSGQHLKATCNGCGKYIKFISQWLPPFTDNSIMPFGMHKGKAMANVPANYLLWLNEQSVTHSQLKEYIKNNLDVLRSQKNESR